jgi:aminoglycoside phosphotransferase (APT) family kinase protein
MHTDLQALFDEPILEQTYFDPGYSGHASDVWLVRTASGSAVARAIRSSELDGSFWSGCHHLFGIDPRRVFDLEPLNALLAEISPIPAPRVLCKGILDGREWVVVEYMPGSTVESFRGQPPAMLEQFGHALARIHSRRFADYGSPAGHIRYPLDGFFARVAETLRMLVSRFYSDDERITAALEPICRAALALPPPASATLVMIDMDVCQFLGDGSRITAVVDTEGYVVGPRELDLIALEYLLDQTGATVFAHGYQSVLPLPNLSTARTIYRYLYLLLEVQGQADLDAWMGWPCLFK